MQPTTLQSLTDPASVARPHRVFVLSALILAMIFLQKFALNLSGGSIGIDAILVWLGLGWLFLRREAGLVPVRALLLLILLLLIFLSVLLSAGSSRLTAVGILLIIHVPLVLQVSLTRTETLRVFDLFQTAMAVIAIIVLLQQATQYTIGNWIWPNLDAVVPDHFLYQGFAYIRPYSWDSPYLTPNGIFFLEPSVVSSYLALSIAVEIVFFRRIARIVFLGIAMFAGVAASGPASLVLAAPFLILKTSPRIRLLIGAAVACLALLMVAGLSLRPIERISELSDENSSGYYRIVRPLQALAESVEHPGILMVGKGAGQSPEGNNEVQWPASKLLFEYGLLVAIAFHIYFLVALFDRPPDRAVVALLVIPFLFFGGGFVAHASVMPLMLFGSLIRVQGTRGLLT